MKALYLKSWQFVRMRDLMRNVLKVKPFPLSTTLPGVYAVIIQELFLVLVVSSLRSPNESPRLK